METLKQYLTGIRCLSNEVRILLILLYILLKDWLYNQLCQQTPCLHFETQDSVNYGIVTEYLTLIWFAMFIN